MGRHLHSAVTGSFVSNSKASGSCDSRQGGAQVTSETQATVILKHWIGGGSNFLLFCSHKIPKCLEGLVLVEMVSKWELEDMFRGRHFG